MESIMWYLRTDEELLEMRKEWKELNTGIPFPLFHFETYVGLEDYKQRVKEQIKSYREYK